MHAWVDCLLPDSRWHGFDPTNNLLTNDYYVKVHTGRDYSDVPPVRGVYRGPFAHTLEVSVRAGVISRFAPTLRKNRRRGSAAAGRSYVTGVAAGPRAPNGRPPCPR